MNLQQARQLFYAQYLGQNVLSRTYFVSKTATIELCIRGLNNLTGDDFLLLKSVSDLTDEDAIQIAKMYNWEGQTKDHFDERVLQFKIDLPCIVLPGYKHQHLKFVFDYFVRKGYLLPFTYIDETGKPVTLSPEEIIKLGWAKWQS